MVLELMPFIVDICGMTDVGLVRENNEDVWAQLPQYSTYLLADGMGGHRAGEVAAFQAVTQFQHEIERFLNTFDVEPSLGRMRREIEHILCLVNTHVYQMGCSLPEYKGMGTTFCCLFIHSQGIIHAHVGDSRIYRFRKTRLDQITKDHSLLRQMIDLGKISKSEEKEFAYKNIITQAIGTEPYIDPSVHVSDLQLDDIYLMCTDGLSDVVSPELIAEILSSGTSKDQANHLIQAAKERGGPDNITVIVLKVKEVFHGEKNLS